ncbi:MAG: hypothetical protein RLZZ540_2006 [Bacteroidota bacterium]|jgi:hypothetical protein
MDGIFKKIVLVLICLTLVCCKDKEYEEHIRLLNEARLKEKELIKEGRKLIQQNSNILIDSVFVFDIKSLEPKVKEEKLSIGLIDSIHYKSTGIESERNHVAFKLHNSDLANFKSEYELHLVQNESQNENQINNILFFKFSNFIIDNNRARIRVRKIFGISTREATFFFEKINNKWVFRKKQVSSDIG